MSRCRHGDKEVNQNEFFQMIYIPFMKQFMIQWLKYFLVGIEQTATQAVQTLTEILKLKSNIEHEAPAIFKRRRYAAIRLFTELYKKPYVNVESASQICNLSYKATNDLIALMSQAGYLKETTGQSRNRLFVFEPYLQIFENK